MTLNEAVDMVDQVCAQVSMQRQAHIQVQVAISLIRQATTDMAKSKKTAKGKTAKEE